MKTLVRDGGQSKLNRIMIILQKERLHNTHYDGPLKKAIESYFKNKATNKQTMAKALKGNAPAAGSAMTKRVRRSLNARAY